MESLNEDESGIFKLLDTLKTVPKFRTYYDIVSILGSGYVEIDKWNIDIGDIYSTFGYNDAEGIRMRAGARTYFGQNDMWRLEGYMAYGFDDKNLSTGFRASFCSIEKTDSLYLEEIEGTLNNWDLVLPVPMM